MRLLQTHIIAVVLLAATAGAASAAEPVGDALIFVPPVSSEAAGLIDTGTDCIALNRIRSARIIAGEGIVYRMSGRKTVINRPRNGGRQLGRDQILIMRTRGSLLCAGDIVHLANSAPGMTAGYVALGRFETYHPPTGQ